MSQLTLKDLANQMRQLSPSLKGVLALVDAESHTLIDLRVDTFENIVALLDGMGAVERSNVEETIKTQP